MIRVLGMPVLIVLMVWAMLSQGCVSSSGRRYECLNNGFGPCYWKVIAQKLKTQLEAERVAREKAPKAVDPEFEKLADEAACETDALLASDPETPDDIRAILYKSLAKCRTKKQEAALDRIVKRWAGKKAKPQGEPIKALEPIPERGPLPKPSLLKDSP